MPLGPAGPLPVEVQQSGTTERLARYSLGTDFASLPEEVVDRAKRVVLDELGCMVLGSTLPPGGTMRQYVGSRGGVAEATVIGGGFRAPAGMAALANGTSSHADELDGVHSTQGHPAGTSVAGALAMCELVGGSGRDLLNAVVLSFDVGCRVLAGLGGGHTMRLAHRTHSSPLYALGVAAAAGRLLGLEPLAVQHAFALAALNNFVPTAFYDEREHMSKAMNQGQAAAAGIAGALLAAGGFEAHDRIIEAEGGLIDVWRTERTDVPSMTAGLGTTFSIMDAGFKYYSAGYPIHAPLAGALRLLAEHGLSTEDVRSVRVGMPPPVADIVDRRTMASICLQDMLSLGLVRRRLLHDDAHDAAALRSPAVVRLSEAVTIVRDPTLGEEAVRRRAAWVEVDTMDGRTHRGPVLVPPGHWESGGMPWDDLEEKFGGLVAPRLGAPAAGRIAEIVRDLDEADDLEELASLLGGPAAPAGPGRTPRRRDA